jgi:SAM-dependent methyltransferase
MGGELDVHGKRVLEAGCGAGRFTEILLKSGASVFAVDLSLAVEANHENCKRYRNYFVCQADILDLPVSSGQFDIVVCLGVIQHTPSPEETMAFLCSHVKPGGLLLIDHYAYGYEINFSRTLLRSYLLTRNARFRLQFCKSLVSFLWPVHRFLWKSKGKPGFSKVRRRFLSLSPVVDYHDAYPQLGPQLLREWAILDTHDTLTDVYKHLRSKEEIEQHLKRCGMVDIEVYYAGNGVEARARKPLQQKSKD